MKKNQIELKKILLEVDKTHKQNKNNIMGLRDYFELILFGYL